MTRRSFIFRITVISFFIGVNIVLGKTFLQQSQINFPQYLVSIFDQVGVEYAVSEKNSKTSTLFAEEFNDIVVTTNILTELNTFRTQNALQPLMRNTVLDKVAFLLLSDELAAATVSANLDTNLLQDLLEKNGYEYHSISHNSVVGPVNASGTIQAILGHEEQSALLLEEQYTDIGLAMVSEEAQDSLRKGYLVYLLGSELSTLPESTQNNIPNQPQTATKKTLSFPVISNTDVLIALNNYRASHGVHALVEESNLCNYASKRVQDLLLVGGLDGHEGFRNDFENNSVPDQLKNYKGTTIGENLAYQHCRNMKTEESFIAESGAALIEWCFDSSTKGHREAQLNSKYNNVCVRNQDGYFVVIFGE